MAAANDISPINNASANGITDDASKAKLQKATKDFESLFVGYMLKGMRSTIPKSGMEKDELWRRYDGRDVRHGVCQVYFQQ